MPSQYSTNLEILRRPNIKKELHIDFLQKIASKFYTVDSADGEIIGMNFSKDANSDLRTNVDLKLVISKEEGEKPINRLADESWIATFVDVSVVYDENAYKIGRFVVNAPQSDYDAESNTLSLSCVDMMSKLTGMSGGVVDYARGTSIQIPKGENVRGVMISILKKFGINDYDLDECRLKNGEIQPVPYDMEFETGTTAYEMLAALRDIMPNYAIYFNVDGVFCYKPIPVDESASVMLPYETLKDIVIQESVSVDYENVKNHIQVYGRTHSVGAFFPSDYATYEDNDYSNGWYMLKRGRTYNGIVSDANYLTCKISSSEMASLLPDQFLVGVVFPEEFRDISGTLFNPSNPSIITDSEGFYLDLEIVGGDGITYSSGAYIYDTSADYVNSPQNAQKVTTINSIHDGVPYYHVFLVRVYEATPTTTRRWFVDYGGLQAFAEARNTKPQSAFSVDKIGERTLVLTGGEYENILNDALAQERADIELYWKTNMQETVTLQTIPIPWLDVDTVITYKKHRTDAPIRYVVKSISCDYSDNSGAMTITAIKFYPYYSD